MKGILQLENSYSQGDLLRHSTIRNIPTSQKAISVLNDLKRQCEFCSPNWILAPLQFPCVNEVSDAGSIKHWVQSTPQCLENNWNAIPLQEFALGKLESEPFRSVREKEWGYTVGPGFSRCFLA